jgi:hypothetical protein
VGTLTKKKILKLSSEPKYLIKLFDKLSNPFVVSFFQVCYLRSQKNANLLYDISKQLQFHGLSNTGVDILQYSGLAPRSRTVFVYKKTEIQNYLEALNNSMLLQTNVLWIDNYNLMLKYVALKSTPYRNCNWTAFATKLSGFPKISFDVNNPVLVNYGITAHAVELMEVLIANNIDEIGSMSLNTNVLYSPPLVKVETPMMFNLKPMEIIGDNIGSNEGLYNVLESKIKPFTEGVWASSYVILKCDINIYYRIVKVAENIM